MAPVLPPRLRSSDSRSWSRRPLLPGAAALYEASGDGKPDTGGRGGIFGLGIGPDINLGLGTLFSDFSQAIPAIGRLVLPGKKEGEPGWADLGKGFATSLIGTFVATPARSIEFGLNLIPGVEVRGLSSAAERLPAALFNDEDLKAQDFYTRAGERGILPALVEDIGNVAFGAGVVGAGAKAGALGARAAGASRTAAALTRIAESPLLRTLEHPYITTASKFRNVATKTASARLLRAYGVDDVSKAAEQAASAASAASPLADVPRIPDADFDVAAAQNLLRVADHIAPEGVDTVVREGNQFVYRDPQGVARGILSLDDDLTKVETLFVDPEFRGQGLSARLYGAVDEAGIDVAGLGADELTEAGARARESYLRARDGAPGAAAAGAVTDAPRAPATPAHVDRLTTALSNLEHWFQSREARRVALEHTRQAAMERSIVARSDAVRQSVEIARNLIMDEAARQGLKITRRQASDIVGDEIFARLSGVKMYESLSSALTDDELVKLGIRQSPIPKELRSPALDAALDQAVEAWRIEAKNVRKILTRGRKGLEGLEGLGAEDAVAPALTRKQRVALKRADQLRERALGETQARKILRQRRSREALLQQQYDKLGRIAAQAERLDELEASTLREFEHSRTWTPKAWRTPEGLAESIARIHEATLQNGGATFDPNTGRFLTPKKDAGYTVAVVPGTARSVPVDQFSPADIEAVIRAYQDIYQHPNTTIGTWVDDKGIVHINPGEIVHDLDDALVLASIRGQEAVYDLARDKAWDAPLKDRPDIAAKFLSSNGKATRGWKSAALQLRRVSERAGFTTEDAHMIMGLNARMAVRAWQKGLVKTPDEFFGKVLRGYRFGAQRSKAEGVLHQMTFEVDLTPDARKVWVERIRQLESEFEHARRWYHDSHDLVETVLDGAPDIQLLDGSTIPAKELMYQLLAATSINQQPNANLLKAMRGFRSATQLMGRKEMRKLATNLKKVSTGKMTLEKALASVGIDSPKAADVIGQTGNLPTGAQYVAEILMGHTIDKWTLESMDAWNAAVGVRSKAEVGASTEAAIARIKETMPEVLDELSEAQATMEWYGRSQRAKIRVFWDNLHDPVNSVGVTMDQRMEQFFGASMEVNGNWLRYSEQIRALARDLTEVTGTHWAPHEVQAALWVWTKMEETRLTLGHFRAYAHDAAKVIESGEFLTDANDPIMAWLDEASAPLQEIAAEAAEFGRPRTGSEVRTFQRRIRSAEGVETVETVFERPAWGAPYKEQLQAFTNRRLEWTKVRDEINGNLAVGNKDKALRLLGEYETKMTTKAPRYGGLAPDDAVGGSFKDIWKAPSENLRAITQELLDEGYLNYGAGDLPPLMQAFEDKILGEFVPLADEAKGVIRIFESGNFATLVHENGHLLRRILDDAQMQEVERIYGIKNGVWDVAAEERFANDFVQWMRSGRAPAGLGSTFARVKQAIKEIWDMVRGTFLRRRVHPSLEEIFADWLDPDPVDFDPATGFLNTAEETGSLGQRAARTPRFPEPPARGRDFYAAGRRGQKALDDLSRIAARRKQLAATQAQVQKTIDELARVLNEGVPAEIEAREMLTEARRIGDRVRAELGEPSLMRTPARWQPLWDATLRIAKEAEQNPALAEVLQDLPRTLQEVQARAIELGFDPVHVRDFTPTQVRRLVFGAMRLGLGREGLAQEVSAGTRKTRTMTLARKGAVDRSFEALFAATVEAINESHTNAVVSWVEDHIARKLPAGAQIPDGWVPWDPARTFLLTGTELTPDNMARVATALDEQTIVPKAVVDTLRRFTHDYDHWVWRTIGKITNPWRTLVLTLSPGWYIRNIVGNIILASVEGVRLQDWVRAWRSYRNKDIMGRFADVPFVQGQSLATEAGLAAEPSLIPRRGIREAIEESGRVRGTAQHVSRRLLRINEVVDEFARAAVYHRAINKLNMTPEQAWKRASEALVDYQALSPFERAAVRSVIPFYSWQKGILKLTMRLAIDHPARTSIVMALGKMNEEYMEDLFGLESQDIPDYYKQLIGNRNIWSYNPFSDPVELLTPEGIIRSLNPFVEAVARKGFGAPEFYTDRQRLGFFGTPQQDTDLVGDITDLATRSPAGRYLPAIGSGDPETIIGATLGLMPQDIDALRSRFLRARTQIRGIPNPETGQGQGGPLPLLPPRLR